MDEPVRTVFMGSDEFGMPSLRALLRASDGPGDLPIRLVGVVTAPDRPKGRGRRIESTPEKQLASQAGIPVVQPRKLRDPESVDEVLGLEPDLVIVASYGQILPGRLLEAPRHGSLNLHPSLLPLYRGASPVAGAILGGETRTGTSLMLMSERMDAGPLLAQTSAEIGPRETAGELGTRLAILSADLLMASLGPWIQGGITPVPQDHDRATYTRLLRKSDGTIDWTLSAAEISRITRAYNPWPMAHTTWHGRQLRILRASPGRNLGGVGADQRTPALSQPGTVIEAGHALAGVGADQGTPAPSQPEALIQAGHDLAGVGADQRTPAPSQPGTVIDAAIEGAMIGTGSGVLVAIELQLEGARPMPAAEFARGHRSFVGSMLG